MSLCVCVCARRRAVTMRRCKERMAMCDNVLSRCYLELVMAWMIAGVVEVEGGGSFSNSASIWISKVISGY